MVQKQTKIIHIQSNAICRHDMAIAAWMCNCIEEIAVWYKSSAIDAAVQCRTRKESAPTA